MNVLRPVNIARHRGPGDLPSDLERLRAMIAGVKSFASLLRARHPRLRDGFSSEPRSWSPGVGDAWGWRREASEVPGSDPILSLEERFILGIDIAERSAGLEERVEARTAQLQAELKEREVLLQEVHHRVKNNLQVISSLISMQARSLHSDGGREALEECQARVQAIALIHDQLYQSKDYGRIPFADYARSLIENVFRAAEVPRERVRLELAVDDVTLAVDKAIPCGLILNELVTNALRHAFPEGRSGTVRVEVGQVAGDGLRLAVKDDGAGLPPGFDVHQSPSLGLQLVCMLAEQIHATIEVDGATGTCFRVTLPVAS